MNSLKRARRRDRRGAVTVEMAMGLPVFFMLVIGLMLFGHMFMVSHLLQTACRDGARLGSVEGATTQDVQDRVMQILASVVPASEVTLIVKDAGVYDGDGPLPGSAEDFDDLPDVEVSDLDAREMFLVRATIDYGNVALLPMPYMQNIVLVGQNITRHE